MSTNCLACNMGLNKTSTVWKITAEKYICNVCKILMKTVKMYSCPGGCGKYFEGPWIWTSDHQVRCPKIKCENACCDTMGSCDVIKYITTYNGYAMIEKKLCPVCHDFARKQTDDYIERKRIKDDACPV